ncbi:MAG: class I SAM-dependent methyltransferase [Oscillospiraceae bacterium]|nr:class I SAM-dependent methyltransferase [Oscillospiraceae bacterium]
MYSDVFCKVYNEFGWNYYPEAFGEQLLKWLAANALCPGTALDLACGTGVLCQILDQNGIKASGMDFSAGMIRIAASRAPHISYEVADMITYRPHRQFDLVTCTGDALNHIHSLCDVGRIFENVYAYLNSGGYFIFDILNENEVSTSEPFEMDFSDRIRVWFRMVRPEPEMVQLQIRVYEDGALQFEERITEKLHDPATVCGLLRQAGFTVVRCADTLLDDPDAHGTTWFVIAKKA